MNDAGAPEIKAAAWSAVGRSRPHESATLHVLGQATYTDDIAEVAGTLQAVRLTSSGSVALQVQGLGDVLPSSVTRFVGQKA